MAIPRCVSSKRHGADEDMASNEQRLAVFRSRGPRNGVESGKRIDVNADRDGVDDARQRAM